MTRPDVLLVTIDSLRADYVSGCHSESPVETPEIDRVGENGTTFSDAVAQGPFTTFSMPSLFTSRYPSRLEYVEFSEGVVGVRPSSSTQTLAERFGEMGYATGGFHSNPLLSSLFNFDAGFEEFDADLPLSDLALPGRFKLLTNKLRRLLRRHAYLTAETITDRAVNWLGETRASPRFCWVHYMDVHGPYQPKTGLTRYNKYRSERLWQKAVNKPSTVSDTEHTALERAYREEIRYTDEHVGRLLDQFEELTDGPTVVALTADHGDSFGENGYYSHPHEVHDELVCVPLFVDDTTGTVEDGHVDHPVELRDLGPTLVDAAGGEPPESFEGRHLDASEEPRFAISEGELNPGFRGAIFSENLKLVVDEIRKSRDLLERKSSEPVRESQEPPEATELREAMTVHLEDRGSGSRETRSIDDEEVRDRLERLGYMN